MGWQYNARRTQPTFPGTSAGALLQKEGSCSQSRNLLLILAMKGRDSKGSILFPGHGRRIRLVELKACSGLRTLICWQVSQVTLPDSWAPGYLLRMGGRALKRSQVCIKETKYYSGILWSMWKPSVSCLDGGTMAIPFM